MRRHDKNVLVTKFMKGILAFLQNCKTRHNEIVQAQHHDKGGGEQIADKLCPINWTPLLIICVAILGKKRPRKWKRTARSLERASSKDRN